VRVLLSASSLAVLEEAGCSSSVGMVREAAGAGGVNDEAVWGPEPPVAANGLYKTQHAARSNAASTLNEGGATQGQAQLAADEQQDHGWRLSIFLLVLTGVESPIPAPGLRLARLCMNPCPARLPCHSDSGEPVPNISTTRFFDAVASIYMEPCMEKEALPRFFGGKSSSTALYSIVGCRGGQDDECATGVGRAAFCTLRLSGPSSVRACSN
jgi:hypothetical protein